MGYKPYFSHQLMLSMFFMSLACMLFPRLRAEGEEEHHPCHDFVAMRIAEL
jgi:hypothetical protein